MYFLQVYSLSDWMSLSEPYKCQLSQIAPTQALPELFSVHHGKKNHQ